MRLAIIVVLLLAGCTSSTPEPISEATIAPASMGHVLLSLASSDPAQIELEVADADGLTVLLPEQLHHNATHGVGWVGFDAPEGASGAYEIVLDVTGAAQERVSIAVQVEEGEGLGAGAAVLVDLVLRDANGTISLNTRADVEDSPLPRSQGYQPAPEQAPQNIQLSPQQLPPHVLEPLADLPVGHSITIEWPDFFGPAQSEEEHPREEAIERRTPMPRVEEFLRQEALQQGFIDESSQEGDIIEAGAFNYVITTLDESMLRLELDVEQGDRLTFYGAWPDATVVEEYGEETVVFRTDVEAQGPITWNPDWPDATEVVSVNDTTILVRHNPPVGLEYQAMTQQGPIEREVTAVREDVILITQQNPHPQAGETMYLEATMVGENEMPQQPMIPQP